jgi:hypothetical protein
VNFAGPAFLAFFLIVYLIYWRLASTRARDAFLLVASYYFYGSWDARFLALIAILTLSSYLCALSIDGSDDAVFRRRILQLEIITSLVILGCFKYFGFFTDSLKRLAGAWGVELGFPAIGIILPVGISHRGSAATGVPDPAKLPLSVSRVLACGVLAQVAHLSVELATRLPVHPAWRKSCRISSNVVQLDAHDAARWTVAWGKLDLRDLGRDPWRCSGAVQATHPRR